MNNKATLRNKLNQKRAGLTTNQVVQMSQQICEAISSSSIFKQSQSIAYYSACFNEVDLSSLKQANKTFALPVVLENNLMTFQQFDKNTAMAKNKYNILEPQNSVVVTPNAIDLCLMPLLGFSRNGDRLGMGGGYYDRYFELNKFQEKPTILAGIAYDFQEDDTIQSEPWDTPLDIIFTNKEVIIV